MSRFQIVITHLTTRFLLFLTYIFFFTISITAAPSPVLIHSPLIVVDGTLPDLNHILADVQGKGIIYLLKSDQDGIKQVNDLLVRYREVKAIHLITHGRPGVIYLGNTKLDISSVEGYREQIKSWSEHLFKMGTIFIYGCSVASGSVGRNLIEKIAEYSGRGIAASLNLTGLGGDWTLEYRTRTIGAQQLFSAKFKNSYFHSLGQLIVTTPVDSVPGSTPRTMMLALSLRVPRLRSVSIVVSLSAASVLRERSRRLL